MAKPYHPCYTDVNPVENARRYTSEKVYSRKVTLIYDWLPPGREVKSWFRRVPYRLEKGDKEGSWVVKYFEFRAGIAPLPQLGFVGDLWISWDTVDPSVWFKVEEMKWERWGACASSVHRQMNAKHPFLDEAVLWFSPRDYFFKGRLPEEKPSLRWDRWARIRRVAPPTRIIDPESNFVPKKLPVNPVHLPSVRTIVRVLCPNMVLLRPPSTISNPASVVDRRDGDGDGDGDGDDAMARESEVKVEVEEFVQPPIAGDTAIGDDVEIDWDWWGSTDNEEDDDESTQVGSPRPQIRSLTPSPEPITPPRNSRYHPYRPATPPATPFSKFKPPSRYTRGTLNPNASPIDPRNTPASPHPSPSSTAVDPAQDETTYSQKPSQQTLEEIVSLLLEDGRIRPGVWALVPPELSDTRDDVVAELPMPILDLKRRTLQEITRLLHKDGFPPSGILSIKVRDPGDDDDDDDDDSVYVHFTRLWGFDL